MRKAAPQHNHVQNQTAARQGGAALDPPQGEQIAQLAAMADSSPVLTAQRKLADMVHNSPRQAAQRQFVEGINNSPYVAAQRQRCESLADDTVQRRDADEPLQAQTAQRTEALAKPNYTGLPDTLKSGIEALSGIAMDGVKVHYNSSQPAQLNALAYAQGTDIHVAPGQEKHLPHEAWHIVQQAQGRVKPTMQMKGVAINEDDGLEQEADAMGARAMQMVAEPQPIAPISLAQNSPAGSAIQCAKYTDKNGNSYETETFDTNGERTKKVDGSIKVTSTSGRGSAPRSIALDHKSGNALTPFLGYDGGHVLGLELGGADENYNVVPMLPKFNRDVWRGVEVEVKNEALWLYSGKNFEVSIALSYASNTDSIPDSLKVVATADEPETKKVRRRGKTRRVPTGKVLRKEVYNKTKSQPGDIVVTTAPDKTQEDLMLGKSKDDVLKALKSSKNRFMDYMSKRGHLPTSTKREYPDSPTQRPYEFLDLLVFSGKQSCDVSSFEAGKDFSSDQRELILKYNLAKNGGTIKSDDPNDPHATLSERGAANFPEIDHIIPKSMGGSNLFSNARVVSWQLNNKEDRVKDITPYISLGRIAFPTVTGKESAEERLEKGKMIIKKVLQKKAFAREEVQGWAAFYLNSLNHSVVSTLIGDTLDELVKDGFLVQTSSGYRVK